MTSHYAAPSYKNGSTAQLCNRDWKCHQLRVLKVVININFVQVSPGSNTNWHTVMCLHTISVLIFHTAFSWASSLCTACKRTAQHCRISCTSWYAPAEVQHGHDWYMPKGPSCLYSPATCYLDLCCILFKHTAWLFIHHCYKSQQRTHEFNSSPLLPNYFFIFTQG